MCGIQLSDRKRSTDLMFMQGLKEAIDQLAMANSVRWCGHVLRREDDNEKGIRFFGWRSKEEGEVVKEDVVESV